MKLPKNYFENLSLSKYREYLKLLPALKKESVKAITMLIFTFFALSLLSIFAINPTLSTIIELHKKLSENEYVYQQLKDKNSNLSNLQQQYTTLSKDLPFVYDAIPIQPKVPTLVGQLEQLAADSNLQITTLTISEVTLTDTKQTAKSSNAHESFTFTLEAEGNYEDMLIFAEALTKFDRIVTIESISIVKDQQKNKLLLGVKGREYFQRE